jgi:hypothetical protein
MLQFGCQEKWSARACQLKHAELHPEDLDEAPEARQDLPREFEYHQELSPVPSLEYFSGPGFGNHSLPVPQRSMSNQSGYAEQMQRERSRSISQQHQIQQQQQQHKTEERDPSLTREPSTGLDARNVAADANRVQAQQQAQQAQKRRHQQQHRLSQGGFEEQVAQQQNQIQLSQQVQQQQIQQVQQQQAQIQQAKAQQGQQQQQQQGGQQAQQRVWQ